MIKLMYRDEDDGGEHGIDPTINLNIAPGVDLRKEAFEGIVLGEIYTHYGPDDSDYNESLTARSLRYQQMLADKNAAKSPMPVTIPLVPISALPPSSEESHNAQTPSPTSTTSTSSPPSNGGAQPTLSPAASHTSRVDDSIVITPPLSDDEEGPTARVDLDLLSDEPDDSYTTDSDFAKDTEDSYDTA
jgi:hypothetical protein